MTAYDPKYSRKNEEARRARSHRVTVDFEKSYFADVLKPAAEKAGQPINTFIKNAIAAYIENATD